MVCAVGSRATRGKKNKAKVATEVEADPPNPNDKNAIARILTDEELNDMLNKVDIDNFSLRDQLKP